MRRVALPLILLTLGGAVAAQIPASVPSTAPVAPPQTAPASVAATAPAAPVTFPSTVATSPDTMPATQASTAPTTSIAPTTAFATTAPSTQPVATALYPSRTRFGGDYSPPPSTFVSQSTGGPDLTSKPYPTRYSAVLTRSIFIKGTQRVIDPGAPRPFNSVDPRNSGSGTSPSPYSPEGILVFNGASDVDGQLVAFVENTGMNRITRYHAGDLVGQGAQGKIAAITLDSIDYQVGLRTIHVMLGQNLNGQDVQVLTTQPVVTGSTTPTTGPSSPDGSGGGGTDSILERLRKRRMQELGQ